MSPRLTLLLLCDQYEPYSLFISVLVSAKFHVLIARTAKRAQRFLTHLTVDAILILPSDGCADEALGSELKRMAPYTPIILLREQSQERQPGIDSLWRADLQDEVLAHAVALFIQQWLLPARWAWLASLPGEHADTVLAGAGPRPVG